VAKLASLSKPWYKQQDFFNQVRMEKIKAWMAQEVVDIFSYHLQALTVTV
jgi:hypothetical protein